MHGYEVRLRKDKRGVDLISDALTFDVAPNRRLRRPAIKNDLRLARRIGDGNRKNRAARKLPAPPLILVQSDNHREAPWLVMKCAR
jgi:hypothetical protein